MKILLPIDGSKTSLNAAKHVAQLVSNMRNKCTVTLISVHDDFGLNHVKQFVSKSVVDDYLRKGRGGLLDLLIGSVAQRVLGSAKQPVLLVK